MKKMILSLLAAVMLFSSCTEEDIGPNTPRTDAPANMVGNWMYGSFNMIDFWKYDGTYAGKGFQLSVVFTFTPKGEYEYYFASEANNYGCTTQAFTYHKGTVEFHNNNSFTIYPHKGNYRGFYNCSPDRNFNRDAQDDELKVQTYYYTFETDEFGKEYMVVRFNEGDAQGSYFKPVTW